MTRKTGPLLLAGLLQAGAAVAQEPAAAPAKTGGPDTQEMLFWFLLSTLVLVLLVFALLFTMIVVKLKPQLRKLYELPTVHDTWSGKVVGLLVGDTRLVNGERKDELMGHEYDGISEYDNDLPPWWKYGFYFTIVFAVGYMGYYHVANAGQLQLAEYETEMRQATLLVSAEADDPNKLTTYTALTAPADLAAGKSIFATNCAPCHGASAEGKVGPNLTDEYWLHGGEINHVYKTIKYGVTSKGMVAWKGKLAGKQILQVASYIQSLQGSKPAGAKEPQGEKEAGGKPLASK
ncbi:cbb3-type cytochrome c oxidase N-terminal domain-containing protein [Hymenobacter endophyticus]|uniref:Cbb3-type cytochrome c oxidase N-terminal domain-containing protein n=1 Tax=Hymenobacter endophyticus TaxID=3076335 RepID=A0ABU3TKY6_9BACT|nr:cbb3-type cytochrome c oxidase N-terminal domain-containing protein [Hymenobacter endophyticus]MDU0372039.1 cbb3-type cytochrome c oxidase N-terminal domain-containing protein [Hymenobacter endophyticus]